VIETNTAAGNGRSGIAMLNSDHNLVRGNSIHDDPLGGIVGFTASHNRIEYNTSPVGLDDASNNNVIAGNTATDAEFGISRRRQHDHREPRVA
jgi:parallel beta-helix repeat protein